MSRLLFIFAAFLTFIAPSSQFTHYEENSCTIIRDADVYGIGVRISYYLTFFSGFIGLAFSSEIATNDAKRGNAIISFLILIILIRNAMQDSLAVFEFEIIFTMQFLLMGPTTLSLAVLGSRLASVALFAVYGVYGIICPWIFFTLVDQGRKEDCELRAFWFAYFDFYNSRWVDLLRFGAVVTCVCSCVITPASLAYGTRLVSRLMHSPKQEEVESEEAKEVRRVARVLSVGLAIIVIPVGCIIFIIFTEKIISGNNIDLSESTLISTSQLIPFIVGIIGLCSTIWTVIKDDVAKRRKPKDSEIGVVTEMGPRTECSACGRGLENTLGEQEGKQEEMVDVVMQEEIEG